MKQFDRRSLLIGFAATAFAGGARAQITISKQFKAGPTASLAAPTQLASTPNLIQADARSPIPAGAVVHIPAFRVELAKTVQKTAQTRGAGARQSSTFVLQNVDDAAMQAMTQALYEKFVADLTSAGFQVAPLAQTQADPNLAKFFNNRPAPINGPSPDGQSTFYAPAGMSVNAIAGDSRLPAGMGAMSVVSSMMSLASGAAKAAQSGLVVMMPRYVLTFIDVDASSDHFLGSIGGVASVSGAAGVRLLPESTRVEVYVPTKGSAKFYQDWFALSSPLLLGGADLSGLRDASSASDRQGTAASAGMAAMMALGGYGGGGSSGYNTNATSAGPRFRQTVQPYVEAVQGEFVKRLKAAVV